MNILVTLNSNYIKPLQVMLKSLFLNNPEQKFCIYVMHSSLQEHELEMLSFFAEKNNHKLQIITVKGEHFADAPVLKHYSIEMYYRLLAFKYLPIDLDRILYLDPDILVINDIRELYNLELNGYLYAAAYHDRASVKELNKLRLKQYDIEAYYNSGVLLMNLEEQRTRIKEDEIYKFVEENRKKLILPDQDVINGLYSKEIKDIDELIYNFDARFYQYYKLVNKVDMDFIMKQTAIIHFCGKRKPWQGNYIGKFHSLYKHYEKLASR
ncbi:glycosyltransferase family 8 protein [Oceanobacillus piezotolerans]|uniref:Glycosyltransferase family 8 protein n=1 Tax=Oceanobacillus piezotolerans TaxID=2448030 RepID=A0A498D408_9BACI|nr:glycosyltransferase family 8 protein [Oceanobacillus piezotolerans]RLL42699.1 glycosyltransferase family 8 protein [Oceanobacillus piezotolerans]